MLVGRFMWAAAKAMKLNRNGGQLLIEILIGLVVITTSLVVSLVAVIHATRVSRVSRNRLEATKYAEQVVEQYRNTRDKDKSAFFTNQTCLGPCGSFGLNSMYSCVMTCSFTPAGAATRVDVTVTMSWDDSGATISVALPTVLTRYDL